MYSIRNNNPFIFFFAISCFYFVFCDGGGSSQVFRHSKTSISKAGVSEDIHHWMRSLEEISDNSSLLLAAGRTRRKDPLDGFKHYTGGWNISNVHYWASVGFTAAPLFVIAAAWFVFFGLYLAVICLCYCCFRKEPFGYSRTAYALSLIFLVIFTSVAIVGCVVLYTGQGRFHGATTDTLNYVVKQADLTVENLENVSDYLSAAKNVGVEQVSLPGNAQSDIDRIQIKLNASATTLSQRTAKNSRDIHKVLDNTRLALIIVAAIMLFLTFLGFILSVFGMQCPVYFLKVLGWILVTGTFILCGVFLLIHNVTADTCVSMDEWVKNPTAHTALDDILPCVDNATAQESLLRSKDITFQLVNLVDSAIDNISNLNFPPNLRPLYYNQSGPLLPRLCNPFSSDLSTKDCAPGEAQLDNATQIWMGYVCEVSMTGECMTTGRLTPNIYTQMSAAVNVSYGLYHYGPTLVDLQDCTFVRETFHTISGNYCPQLRLYSRWIYIGLVMVSAAVMLSLVFWVIYARQMSHRKYAKFVHENPP